MFFGIPYFGGDPIHPIGLSLSIRISTCPGTVFTLVLVPFALVASATTSATVSATFSCITMKNIYWNGCMVTKVFWVPLKLQIPVTFREFITIIHIDYCLLYAYYLMVIWSPAPNLSYFLCALLPRGGQATVNPLAHPTSSTQLCILRFLVNHPITEKSARRELWRTRVSKLLKQFTYCKYWYKTTKRFF